MSGMARNYAFTGFDTARMARAQVRDASVSLKKSLMIARQLRGMMTDRADAYLESVKALRTAVPFTRFRDGAGHRKGPMAAGKYPVKAAAAFLDLVRSGVANAEDKGLGTPLKIIHVTAQEGSRPIRPGRKRGQLMKRTHLELVLVETEASKKRKKQPKKAKGKKAEKAPEEQELKVVSKLEDAPAKQEAAAPKKPKTDASAKPAEKQDAPKEAAQQAPEKVPEQKKGEAKQQTPASSTKKDVKQHGD